MKHMQKISIQGFTLIEMLIVIAVISILAGIVLVGVTGFQETARDTKRVGDLRSVQNTVELFYARCGHYPRNTAGCDNTGTIDTWAELGTTLENAGVISDAGKLPSDPQGSTYLYVVSADGLNYAIGATLEN